MPLSVNSSVRTNAGIALIALPEFARSYSICGIDTSFTTSCLFIFTFKGMARIGIRRGELLVASNCIYMLCPKQLDHLTLDPGTEGYVILLSDSFLLELQLIKEFQLLSEQHQKANKPLAIPVDEVFRIFLFYLSTNFREDTWENALTRDLDITNRFFKLVSETGTMQKRINDYARELQVSPNNLGRIIKKSIGVSPISYVHQRFILSAKKLALETPLSMKEIAYKLGFEDAAHFSKFFKSNTGSNFSQFKRSSMHSSGDFNNSQME